MTVNLCIKQSNELLPAGLILRVAIALVQLFELLEFVSRKNIQQLTKNIGNLSHSLELLVISADTKGFAHFLYRCFSRVFRPSLLLTGHY
jgi:hypothetical protein